MTALRQEAREKEIAEAGLILMTVVGSGLHGTAIEGTDDHDEMGICIEPPECVIGLDHFEQHEFRTQPRGHRSGPGDVDRVVYSLRKWMRLALAGNPTVLLPLFAPAAAVLASSPTGDELRAHPEWFHSQEAGWRFLGYLRAQKERLDGTRGGRHTNRPELESVHGFDTKYAMHAIRLGLQGLEFIQTGRITLPVPEADRKWLVEMRLGQHPLSAAIERIHDVESDLDRAIRAADIPPRGDSEAGNAFLVRAYQRHWTEER